MSTLRASRPRVLPLAACALAAALLLACGRGARTATPGPRTTPAVAPAPASARESPPGPAPEGEPPLASTPSAAAAPLAAPLATEARAAPMPPAAAVIERVPGAGMRVALSFDAGADPGHTVPLLDILKGEGVHATFGITGQWAEQQPALVRRITAEGHQVINHTYDHASLTGRSTGRAPLNGEQVSRELDQADTVLQRLTGHSTRPYFRPPYGDLSDSARADAAAAGYGAVVLWSVDSLGWAGLSAAEIVERSLSRVDRGAIYVFHVGAASQDAAALPAILRGLRAQGYAIGSVAELLAAATTGLEVAGHAH